MKPKKDQLTKGKSWSSTQAWKQLRSACQGLSTRLSTKAVIGAGQMMQQTQSGTGASMCVWVFLLR